MTNQYEKVEISFNSGKDVCYGFLYLPSKKDNLPCIVMAHGFSGTMDWLLPNFAKRFVSNGFAVLIFDYRHFGKSGGEPRQIVDITQQREDLQNAINFAKKNQRINPNQIILWGTSLGGSHVITVAACEKVAAVIANIPALDILKGGNFKAKLKKLNATKIQFLITVFQLFIAAIIDLIKELLGLSPYYIKVYGKPGRAFFTDPDLADRFQNLQEKSSTWKNLVAPRFIFKLPRYKKGTIEKIKVPILFTLGRKDVEVSSEFVKNLAKKAQKAEIKEYEAGHFDIYQGKLFEQVVDDQIKFLRSHLSD